MTGFKRYAIYYAPRRGAFAEAAAEWLGWDVATGKPVAQPDLADLPARLHYLTASPRKYGFHGTLKAPFRLAAGQTESALQAAVAGLARRLAPVRMAGLRLARLGGFLALIPDGDESGLLAMASDVVRALDSFRAPLTPEERARRKPDGLSPRQRELLDHWGYPHVMELFRFHLTLTDDLPQDQVMPVAEVAQDWFAPVLPAPFVIEDLCLFAEDFQGRFHLIGRHALLG
jgi:putative phosphonate metabolism protein